MGASPSPGLWILIYEMIGKVCVICQALLLQERVVLALQSKCEHSRKGREMSFLLPPAPTPTSSPGTPKLVEMPRSPMPLCHCGCYSPCCSLHSHHCLRTPMHLQGPAWKPPPLRAPKPTSHGKQINFSFLILPQHLLCASGVPVDPTLWRQSQAQILWVTIP